MVCFKKRRNYRYVCRYVWWGQRSELVRGGGTQRNACREGERAEKTAVKQREARRHKPEGNRKWPSKLSDSKREGVWRKATKGGIAGNATQATGWKDGGAESRNAGSIVKMPAARRSLSSHSNAASQWTPPDWIQFASHSLIRRIASSALHKY